MTHAVQPLEADQLFWLLDLVRKQPKSSRDDWVLVDFRLQDQLMSMGWSIDPSQYPDGLEHWNKILTFPGMDPVGFNVAIAPRPETG